MGVRIRKKLLSVDKDNIRIACTITAVVIVATIAIITVIANV